MPQLFNLYLQITDPATIAEYQDVDPEVITDDLQYGFLLEACTLKDPSVHPALQLLIQVQMPDLDDDEGEYLPEEVLKELRLSPSELLIRCIPNPTHYFYNWNGGGLRQGSTVSRTCSRKA